MPALIVPESYFPYIIQKTIIFRILLSLLFSAYLILAFIKKEYRPQKSWIFWAVAAYYIIMVITTFTGLSPARSWWGNWERSLGTFNLLHYLGWFVMLICVFKKIENWSRIFNFSLIVSVLISLYSIAQRLGLPVYQSGLERVNGTMGNASYLATYMLLHIFIGLLFFAEKKSVKWRIYYLAVVALDAGVMFLTGTRGVIIAVFAGLVVFLIFLVWLKPFAIKLSRVLLGLTILGLLAGVVLFWQKDADFVKNNYWLKRISGLSFQDNTVQTRIRSWSWGLKGFRDYLFLGVGQENYQVVFNRYFTGDFYDYSSSEIWFDRAHNTYVDQASTMGIFGIMAYLLIFYSAFRVLNNLRKSGHLSAIGFILLWLMFFTYFVQNIFVFDSLNSYIIFFLLLAYLHYLSVKFQPQEQSQAVSQSNAVAMASGVGVALALFGVLLFGVNAPEVKANNLVFDGFMETYGKHYDITVAKYKQARKITVNKLDLPVLLSSALGEALAKETDPEITKTRVEDLRTAVDWMNQAIALDPHNMFLYYIQAKNYALLVEKASDSEALQKGLAITDKAHQLSPGRIRPFWLYAQYYLFAGQFDKALESLDKAEAINPRLPETYFYRSIVYQNLQDEENFYKQYDNMIDNHSPFYSAEQIRAVIPHYEQGGDIKRTIVLFQELAKFEPRDPNVWDYLVDLLEKDKQYETALGTLKLASENLPSYSGTAYQRYIAIQKKMEAEAAKQ